MGTIDRALWQKVIHQVISEGGHLIRPWFAQLEPNSLDHGLLEIETPGAAEKKYCERHAARLFTEAAQSATGRLVGVCFVTPPADTQSTDRPSDTPAPGTDEETSGISLNDDYTFEALVIGPSNRLAHAASLAISESPGKAYNPLFIHGSVGLGKTHMLQASCHKIASERPGANICFLTCETFVNHFIQAVERGELNHFRYRYRHADVLAIDDIQFISNHERTQEEFFHTFNTLYQAQKQIVLSSDRSPTEIAELEERLVSRFNWGLVARIDRPCYETRVAIVRKKARLRNIEIPEDVICFVAAAVDSNTRELEGAIAKVAILARVMDCAICLALAEEALGSAPEGTNREVTVDDILKAVTTRFNVRVADLQSKKRSRSIAFPRQICMYLARRLTRHSLEEIGGYFGGRDHTTVLHANKAIQSMRAQDPQLQATLDQLAQQITVTA